MKKVRMKGLLTSTNGVNYVGDVCDDQVCNFQNYTK